MISLRERAATATLPVLLRPCEWQNNQALYALVLEYADFAISDLQADPRFGIVVSGEAYLFPRQMLERVSAFRLDAAPWRATLAIHNLWLWKQYVAGCFGMFEVCARARARVI